MGRMDEKAEKIKKANWEETRFGIWVWFLHLLAAVVLGLALFPMVFFFYAVWQSMAAHAAWLKILVFSFSIGFGYFLFGATLITLCAFFKNLFGFRVKPGLYSIYSKECLSWMGYNSMILLANAAFLDVLRISPFQNFFYRVMGAKVGKGVNVNTSGLADLELLEIGDHVTVGGGVALICHASERGLIRLAPTKLGNNVSIGIGSVIMPDVEMGDRVTIAPMSFVPKGSRIPSGALWGGNPAKDLRQERRQARASNEPLGNTPPL
jgi:non-ribosomal peptide synthetase-like protein